MKPKLSLLLLGVGALLSGTVSAAVERTAEYEEADATAAALKELGVASYDCGISIENTVMVLEEIAMASKEIDLAALASASPYDLARETMLAKREPVKNRYGYVYRPRFDWRHQKK